MIQTGIVRLYKGERLTSSKLVATKFEKFHKHVLEAIRNLECSEDFRKTNFRPMLKIRQLPNGGTKEDTFYVITRDGFSFLAMGFTGKKAAMFKEDFIKAFNELEQYIKQQVPKDLPSALRAYALEVEEHTETQKKLIQAEPHVLFSKTVQATDKTIDMKKVSGIIGVKGFGRNKLFEFLRIEKILMNDNVPYRIYIDRDYFEVREVLMETKKGDRLFTQTIVTQKGLDYIIKKLKQFGIIKNSEENVEIE